MPSIKQAKILIMATDGFEQSELFVPLEKLKAAGATVHIASPKTGEIKGWDKTDWGKSVPVDIDLDDADADDYDALVLPGGQINPDVLRINEKAVELVLDFLDAEKIVAAICHAPWLLVEADAVEGRTLTSWPSVKTDIENAGGDWVDEEVVVDDNIITSRSPKDLDAFVAKIIEELEQDEGTTLRHRPEGNRPPRRDARACPGVRVSAPHFGDIMLSALNSNQVCFLIVKLREFGVQAEPDLGGGSDASDDKFVAVYDNQPDASVKQEAEGAIEAMNVDEQRELIALLLVGRGDYSKEEWVDAVKAAASHPEPTTSAYLLQIPLAADYLEEGLAAFGQSCADVAEGRL